MNSFNIDISIIITSYNHSSYIKQAIESILAQDFKKEKCQLIIAEDCSQDNTREIIDSFDFSSYYQVIKLYRQKNIGLILNFSEALRLAKGQFIAFISGDDYWINPLKLNLQCFKLLENPDCSAVYTAVEVVNADLSRSRPIQFESDSLIGINDWINLFDFPFGINASSCFFRNQDINLYLDTISGCSIEDLPLSLLFLRNNNKILFLKEITTAYRRHPESLWKSFDINTQLYSKLEALINTNHYLFNDQLKHRIINDLQIFLDKNKKNTLQRIYTKLVRSFK